MEILITIFATLFAWQVICCLVYHFVDDKDITNFQYFFVVYLWKLIGWVLNIFNVIIHGIAVCYDSPAAYFIYTRNPFKARAIKRELKKRHEDIVWYLRHSNFGLGVETDDKKTIEEIKKHQYNKIRVFYA